MLVTFRYTVEDTNSSVSQSNERQQRASAFVLKDIHRSPLLTLPAVTRIIILMLLLRFYLS